MEYRGITVLVIQFVADSGKVGNHLGKYNDFIDTLINLSIMSFYIIAVNA